MGVGGKEEDWRLETSKKDKMTKAFVYFRNSVISRDFPHNLAWHHILTEWPLERQLVSEKTFFHKDSAIVNDYDKGKYEID